MIRTVNETAEITLICSHDALVKNPKLYVNPALKKWNQSGKLAGLKFMRTLWLRQAGGGSFQYTGKEHARSA